MQHRLIICLLIFLGSMQTAQALEVFQALKKEMPLAEKVGQSRLTTLLFDVYYIALFAPKGQWREDRSAALSIEYKLSIDGIDLAERSADEMRRQKIANEKIVVWEKQLKTIFPDVKKGTVISALYNPQKETRFYRDGKEIGVVHDTAFGPAFFAIWLGEQTSEPDVRAELLGAP